MNTFPTLTYKPKFESFSDELSDQTVLVGDASSGYPVLNKLFTFDPRTFTFEQSGLLEADKQAVMTFYEANKDVPFYWVNGQNGATYEVIFMSKPSCRLDERIDLWRIGFVLQQTSP